MIVRWKVKNWFHSSVPTYQVSLSLSSLKKKKMFISKKAPTSTTWLLSSSPFSFSFPNSLVSTPYVSPLLPQCLPHLPILHHQIKFLKEFWFCCVIAQISSRMLQTGYSHCGRQTNALYPAKAVNMASKRQGQDLNLGSLTQGPRCLTTTLYTNNIIPRFPIKHQP